MEFEKFGKYLLLRKLAVGGMAEIFLAKQPGLAGFEKLVVIKRIQPTLATNPDYVEMFLDEARLVAGLSHPNIAQVFDLDRVGDIVYIAMEYVSGQDLHAVLKACRNAKLPLPPAVIARILIGACDGLHYAHTLKDQRGKPLNIIHRDVTPTNILISYDGVTKLLDFGIAKAESHVMKTVAGTVKGKFPYMAPEQIQIDQIDARADLWTLGVVLWEALALRRLFGAANELAIIKAVCERPIPPLHDLVPNVPRELEGVVGRALQRDRARRYASALEMQKDLEQYVASLPIPFTTREVSLYLKHKIFPEQYAEQDRLLADLPHATPEQFAVLERQTEPSSYSGVSSAKPMPRAEPGKRQLRLAGLTAAVAVALAGLVWLALRLSTDATGEIRVTSTPEGAHVLVNGQPLPDPTPLTLRNMALTRHQLRLELDGREPQSAVVELSDERRAAVVALTLAPAVAKLATLDVVTDPVGAAISLDGAAPVTSPALFEGVAAGVEHTLTITREGHDSVVQTVRLEAGSRRDILVQLKPSAPGAGAIKKPPVKDQGAADARVLATRLRRVKSAWEAKREQASANDARLFDGMIASIQKLVQSGQPQDLVEAKTSLDDFVQTAFRGVEP